MTQKMTLLFADNFHLASVCDLVDEIARAPDDFKVNDDGPLVHMRFLLKNELSRRGFDFKHHDTWERDDVGHDPVELLTEQEFQRRKKEYKRETRLVFEDERLMLNLLSIIANCDIASDVRRNLPEIKSNMLLVANWQAGGRIASNGGSNPKRDEGIASAVDKILIDGGANQSVEAIWRKLESYTEDIPLEVSSASKSFEVYRSGEYLYSDDAGAKEPKAVKRSSFDRIVNDIKNRDRKK